MRYDVIVIGAGPAGLEAARAAREAGKTVLVIEREARAGGILKQCVHDGFGVIRYGEKLTGPEYAYRTLTAAKAAGAEIKTGTFVTKISKTADGFKVETTSRAGMASDESVSLILATGCRERTPRQVDIHGTRPAGVLTAGACQNFVNLKGLLPGKRVVILGSGDIGLIMARRLTLEGAEVIGVYEAKSTPSGLERNLRQCLDDFGIPLHLKHTVTDVYGQKRVEAVAVSAVDDNMTPVGEKTIVPCDLLVVSVGLIPENELHESLGLKTAPATKGIDVDQYMMSADVPGLYSVGNALHVHDLVDYVSESAATAGRDVGKRRERNLIKTETEGLQYVVPQYIDASALGEKTIFYMRSPKYYKKAVVRLYADGELKQTKRVTNVRPPEMLRIPFSFEAEDSVRIVLEEDGV